MFKACSWSISESSAIVSMPHWSSEPARLSGVVCPSSTRSRCSGRCSIPTAAVFSSGRPTAGQGRSVTWTTRTFWKPRSRLPAGVFAFWILRPDSSSTPACSVQPRSSGSSSRSKAHRGSSCHANPCSAGRKHARWCCRDRITCDSKATRIRFGSRPTFRPIFDGRAFTLTGRHRLALTWGSPIEEPLPGLFDHFLSETTRYWQGWVKHCDIPPSYQRQVIRSALALKLNCFENHGGDYCRAHHLDSGSAAQPADLGLPVLLAAGCLLHDRRVPIARTFRRTRAVHQLRIEHRRRQSGSVVGAPVQRRRIARAAGADCRQLGGLQQRRPGAGRQRGGAARAARYLRRAAHGAVTDLSRRAIQRRADA